MTKADKLVFWGVLLVSLASLLLSNVIFSRDGEKTAVIEVDGKPYASYNMQELTKPKSIGLKTEYGKNVIEISKDSVKVTDSDCKDHLCLGEIEKPNELLVCLPHKLIVRIEGAGEVDSVAY